MQIAFSFTESFTFWPSQKKSYSINAISFWLYTYYAECDINFWSDTLTVDFYL